MSDILVARVLGVVCFSHMTLHDVRYLGCESAGGGVLQPV
eukprot:CAMPEP_0181238154 /NCGR_PEP_ID=MMETSP1096-20121128/39181_1 /TAXON_ID=156174 ORGANISM="Chrysochromulina ericina, Strain CCMP281" /NCGR_SAMPLE_ID=MMETSP1096 /ASSEMBLY_ACC=CAM_ASM_000453 /LENGTH=39 /DNA_ID= /DNA_START= /DNA_END= /DNA_ORIENTATION=